MSNVSFAAITAYCLAFAMAGGYGTRIEETVQAQVHTYQAALQAWRRWQNPAA